MSNPVLNSSFNTETRVYELKSQPMTISGVMNKLCILAIIMSLSGSAVWYQFVIGNVDKVMTLTNIGFFAGFVLALLSCFVRKIAPVTIPLYAIAEGAALAGISCIFEAQFPGIVIKAVSLTFISLFAMYFLYITKLIKVTEKLRSIIFTMTASIAVFYLISIVLNIFNINIPMLYDSSPLSIGFSIFVCGLAASNLLLDFDFIEQATKNFFPKEYEWFGAFGLIVTIAWLYVEILRLLSKLDRR